jgi:hypothetical protein
MTAHDRMGGGKGEEKLLTNDCNKEAHKDWWAWRKDFAYFINLWNEEHHL